ncbi:MAG: hypothetical protein IT209_06510 [Armatimonadetes bacterium]|nr:hypothetical protein [Armatimonadota bacterium]
MDERHKERERLAASLTVAWSNVSEDQGALAKQVVFATYRDFLERLKRLDEGLEDLDERVV